MSKLFQAVSTEKELFGILKAGSAAGAVPKGLIPAFQGLYESYKQAVLGSGVRSGLCRQCGMRRH